MSGFTKHSLSLALLCLLSSLGNAAIVTLSGANAPNALVKELGNSDTNDFLLTTLKSSGTSWNASGGLIKLTTGSLNKEVWFGTSNNFFGDDSGFTLSRTGSGNSLTMSSLLTEGSSSWEASFYDQDGYNAWLGFDYTENGEAMPGVWARMNGTEVRLTPDGFDTNSLHTYTSHVFEGSVAYFIDGELVATGAANRDLDHTVAGLTVVGDRSASTGVGAMWIDSLQIDNNAGAFDDGGLGGIGLIPEPSSFGFMLSLGLAGTWMLMRRRRR